MFAVLTAIRVTIMATGSHRFRAPMSVFIPSVGRYVSNVYSKVVASPAVLSALNFIDGQRCDPQERNLEFDLIAPSTGEVLRKVACCDIHDINRAVSSSRRAFQQWSHLSGFQRGHLLHKAAETIRSRCEEIAHVEVLDCGKPIYEARMDVEGCADTLDYYAGIAASITGEHIQMPDGNYAYTVKEPIGLVGGIGAWNYPFQMAAWKSAPALACGNTMVFKPSPLTPLTAVMLAEIYTEVGLPPGCFNVIQGDGEVGGALCRHEEVDKLTFTGSVQTGVKVMEAASQGVKAITLELGGKSPLIIFDDCDIENAVKGIMIANFLSQGQVCSNAARVFVHHTIVDDVVERLVERTRRIKIGDPYDEDTRVGATINKDQADKVIEYIESAIHQGARVVYGGERVTLQEPGVCSGHYVRPCIISGCNDDMTVVKEEIFGAVVTILPFFTEEEVIERANKTPYGLAGGIFTKDMARAHRVISNLQAGSLFINSYNVTYPGVPFGGYKMSGLGRENGLDTINYYTQIKSVFVETNDLKCPF